MHVGKHYLQKAEEEPLHCYIQEIHILRYLYLFFFNYA